MAKFPNIEYNLSCDKIRYNNEIESLKNNSLNIRIGKLFKDIFKSKPGKKVFEYKNFEDKDIELRRSEKLVDEQLKTEIGHLRVSESLRKTKVHFMQAHISSFLKKYPYLYIVSPEDLFPYVVFTSQGTINTRKSLYYLRNENFNRVFQRLQLSCHLFLEDDVKQHFLCLSNNVKANVVAEMKNDFSIEFCVREAKIYDELLLEAFEGYPHDKESNYKDSFIKAIETDDEIAVDYLWKNKIKIDERSVILEIALKKFAGNSLKTNIIMFLLFQVNENEFEDFFRSFSFSVIENVIKEVRWHCVFDKVFDALKIYFNNVFVLKIFRLLTESHCILCPLELNLDFVVNFFSSLSASDKFNIMWNRTPNEQETLSSSAQEDELPYERVLLKSLDRMDYLEKMLRVGNGPAIKNFFKSNRGVNILSKAYNNEKLNNIFQALRNVIGQRYLNEIFRHFDNYLNFRL
ncbi:UNVERIFIED_CONTAM: hypothetical protein RMT77_011350 [Armadillidium vulgare]